MVVLGVCVPPVSPVPEPPLLPEPPPEPPLVRESGVTVTPSLDADFARRNGSLACRPFTRLLVVTVAARVTTGCAAADSLAACAAVTRAAALGRASVGRGLGDDDGHGDQGDEEHHRDRPQPLGHEVEMRSRMKVIT